ncbi:MAG: outer membrane beta-barrel protein [Treponema sp.]|jgi:hypothetical protein|nr:outer membrane beta-barrel protein [Treponema sp.]
MSKVRFFRGALFLALFTALAVGASAQITISGGAALSSMSAEVGSTSIDGDIGFGGNIYADYLLPIGVPLSLGIEAGFDTASIEDGGTKVTGNAIPLLARVAYHFDLMANLDLYLVGKIGYVLGFAETGGESESGFGGIGFGFDVGVAYYFTPRIGVFAEAGFDRYNLEKDISGMTVKAPFSRFVTVGISTKF